MCSSALIHARMGKVIFGAYDKKRGGLGGSIDLSKHESAHHKMEIIGGICSVILDERGRCIGRGVNTRNINKDPLGHAEIMALRQASLIKNDWRFNECTIITNLEPCTMCSSALIQARMGKVIFGAYDKKRGGLGGSIDLSKHESAHHKMEIVGGILEDECSQILQIWFKKLRTQK